MNPTPEKKGHGLLYIIIVAVIAAVGGYFAFGTKDATKQDSATPSSSDTGTQPVTTDTQPATPATTYKDGTYSASGEYETPEQMENIGVTLVVKGDVVTDAIVKNTAVDRQSKNYQDIFIGTFKPQVVGKKLDEVNVSNISGSSLTQIGFNKAIESIKLQAKS